MPTTEEPKRWYIYRLSDYENPRKPKLEHATKRHCLQNFVEHFGNERLVIVADRLSPALRRIVDGFSPHQILDVDHGNVAGPFLCALEHAATQLGANDSFYMCEDDYLHTDTAQQALWEVLDRVDYATLYDHPDKYMSPSPNPFVTPGGGEATEVFRTASSHWKLTNSTTMTWATKVETLRKDLECWQQHAQGDSTDSLGAFLTLSRTKGRTLASPIPGLATHCETRWLTPGRDWTQV